MPLPDRPVAGADIETDWGQQVHDYTFAPKGCKISGATRTVNTTPDVVDLSVADADPGGFLDALNDRLEVPTGGEGLYQVGVRLNSVNGDAGTQTRVYINLNGSNYASAIEDNDGGVNIVVALTIPMELAAGDLLKIYGQRRGTGTNPTVHVLEFTLIRLGAEFGA